MKQLNFLNTKTRYVNHIHFIGIGGIGMSGIAETLLKNGYIISGSDLKSSDITKKLQKLGAKIFFNHSKCNIKNANIIVISSAIPPYNPEIVQAKSLNIPVIKRGKILAEIIRYKYGIAVSGTHGKTTTSAIIFSIFFKSNLDPTLINGGHVREINSNTRLGKSPYYIVEADESDASFLYLRPIVAVVTNIDNDHLDNYCKTFNNIKLAFIKFIQNLPFNGTAIICFDDKNIRKIIPLIRCNVITYGFHIKSDIRIKKYTQKKFSSYFKIIRKHRLNLNITLNIPGKHNALNAAAAIAVATQKNISDINILESLKTFKGVKQRFELCGKFLAYNASNEHNIITIIQDYGHHPNEILASINTVKLGWPNKKLVMIFQPHRYTRTYYLFKQFKKVLLKIDELLLLNVYSANENPISGSNSLDLYNELKKCGKTSVTLISNYNEIFKTLVKKLSENNVLLIQGAGNIHIIIDNYVIKKLKKINKK
ncbi:MAG: UDP-N-acetylmuramate--L-alanine ligase [Buchnera aphidicola (Meitanaphis flavogallis)]